MQTVNLIRERVESDFQKVMERSELYSLKIRAYLLLVLSSDWHTTNFPRKCWSKRSNREKKIPFIH